MRTILAAAMAVFLCVQAEARCVRWDEQFAVLSSIPHVKTFGGELAAEIIDILNRMPPPSEFDGEVVELFFNKEADEFLFVIGSKECATAVLEVPSSVFRRAIGIGI